MDPKVPSTITAFPPGYIERDLEVVKGLQCDKPLKRAIKPNGGYNMVKAALKSYGFEHDPVVEKIFTEYRKTHNMGVFDAYTKEMKVARSNGILTGLPDGYGRGRIIGDYRRVALYGVDELIAAKERDSALIYSKHSTEETIRIREEIADQIRSLKELKEMAASYGDDISGPAKTAAEAV